MEVEIFLNCTFTSFNQVLPQQATDGEKAIWYQFSSNVPSTHYEAQMFIWNGHEVGKWKLGGKLLSSKTSSMPHCKQAGQPPGVSVGTWFSYSLLIIEDAESCLCLAWKPQLRDGCFVHLLNNFFQWTSFCEKFSTPQCAFLRLHSKLHCNSHALHDSNPHWLPHNYFTRSKLHSLKYLDILRPLVSQLPFRGLFFSWKSMHNFRMCTYIGKIAFVLQPLQWQCNTQLRV